VDLTANNKFNKMNYLGHISTEGGPLIISDFNAVDDWNGIEGHDYEQMCAIFDSDLTLEGFSVNFKSYLPIAWELEGSGIIQIYNSNDEILLIKTWLSEKELDLNNTELLTKPISKNNINIGNLTVNTDFIFLFWATESLYNVKIDKRKEQGRPNGSFSMEDSVFFLKTSVKNYSCLHDVINENGLFARRLHLIPIR
jgi:hypothetical protein